MQRKIIALHRPRCKNVQYFTTGEYLKRTTVLIRPRLHKYEILERAAASGDRFLLVDAQICSSARQIKTQPNPAHESRSPRTPTTHPPSTAKTHGTSPHLWSTRSASADISQAEQPASGCPATASSTAATTSYRPATTCAAAVPTRRTECRKALSRPNEWPAAAALH